MSCSADTPTAMPINNHHELVGKAVEEIAAQSTTSNIGAILGNRFSTRYRIIQLLEHAYERPIDLFYTEEIKTSLKLAIDDIYNNPLLESTKTILGQMLRRSSQEEIVDYVLELRRNGTFCRISEDTNQQREPQIICSMGLSLN